MHLVIIEIIVYDRLYPNSAGLKHINTKTLFLSRYTIGAFVSSFFISWFAFTLIWYLISLLHGDLDSNHLPNSPAQMNGTWVPCVTGIYNLASCFLFSVETQHTIG